MRQLLPEVVPEVDVYEAYRPQGPGPLLRLNMVASADGAVTDATGRAAGLAGEGDREVFRVLRALADAIVVGAGTARIEGYGPHRLAAHLAPRRAADGRPEPAAVVLVSRALDLDPAAPVFSEARTPTVVLTCAAADRDRRAALERTGRVLVAGEREVDLAAGLALLRSELGYAQLLCEGGPLLNAALLAAGLVDELCLTLAPMLAGGHGPGLVTGLAPGTRPLALLAALEDRGELYLRYRIVREG